jgi:hypothetical protein
MTRVRVFPAVIVTFLIGLTQALPAAAEVFTVTYELVVDPPSGVLFGEPGPLQVTVAFEIDTTAAPPIILPGGDGSWNGPTLYGYDVAALSFAPLTIGNETFDASHIDPRVPASGFSAHVWFDEPLLNGGTPRTWMFLNSPSGLIELGGATCGQSCRLDDTALVADLFDMVAGVPLNTSVAGRVLDSATVFVTSALSTGALGGVDGASDTCSQLASAVGLAGSYRAWLSSSTPADVARVSYDLLLEPPSGSLFGEPSPVRVRTTFEIDTTVSAIVLPSGTGSWNGPTLYGYDLSALLFSRLFVGSAFFDFIDIQPRSPESGFSAHVWFDGPLVDGATPRTWMLLENDFGIIEFGGGTCGQPCFLNDTGGAADGEDMVFGSPLEVAVARDSLVRSPSEGFNRLSRPYVLVDGTRIAEDWDDLTDGTLLAPIRLDETGTAHDCPAGCDFDALPMTNTSADGTLASAENDCSAWTSSAGAVVLGATNGTDSGWTQLLVSTCAIAYPFYCFDVSELPPGSISIVGELADLADAIPGQDRWLARYRIDGSFGYPAGYGLSLRIPLLPEIDVLSGPSGHWPGWRPELLLPDPNLPSDGALSVVALSGDPESGAVLEFSFLWQGAGAQPLLPSDFSIHDDQFAVLQTGTVTPGAVPEPGARVMAIVALLTLAAARRVGRDGAGRSRGRARNRGGARVRQS